MLTPETLEAFLRAQWEPKWIEIRERLSAQVRAMVDRSQLSEDVRAAFSEQSQILLTAMLDIAFTFSRVTTVATVEMVCSLQEGEIDGGSDSGERRQ